MKRWRDLIEQQARELAELRAQCSREYKRGRGAQALAAKVADGSFKDRAERAEADRDALTDVLRRAGFVQCDIAACNCGSWHARYGLPERWNEIKSDLADAGYPLCNENGHVVRNALAGLVRDRDALADKLRAAEADAERMEWIERNGIGVDRVPLGNTNFDLWQHGEKYSALTARAAIDAARAAIKETK